MLAKWKGPTSVIAIRGHVELTERAHRMRTSDIEHVGEVARGAPFV